MRVVLVPGFTQTAESWAPVQAELPDGLDVTALDVPDGFDFVATALALGDAGGRALYVGYSLGGRLCLRLALDRPDLVAGLLLVSTSPGIADGAARSARRAGDEELARHVEGDGAEPFLDRWLAQPLFATLPRGRAGPRLDDPEHLARQLRLLGQGTQEPLWDRLPDLAMPVLLAVGGRDEEYVEIARSMRRAIGDHADASVLDSAGHAVHLEHPLAFAVLLLDLIGQVSSA